MIIGNLGDWVDDGQGCGVKQGNDEIKLSTIGRWGDMVVGSRTWVWND